MLGRVFSIAIVAVMTAGVTVAAAPTSYRTYRNPSNSVHIQPQPCGTSVCGVVVWASAKAKADAARGGATKLVGMQLFKNFTPDGPDRWKGSVFVPDINKTFTGQVVRTGPTTLKGIGCLVGKMGCKSQEWTLVK